MGQGTACLYRDTEETQRQEVHASLLLLIELPGFDPVGSSTLMTLSRHLLMVLLRTLDFYSRTHLLARYGGTSQVLGGD